MRNLFNFLLLQKPQESDLELNTEVEKKWIRKKIKKSKKELEEAIEERDILKDKYLLILEEKCVGFDQYKYWENKSSELSEENKGLKKDIASLKKELKDFNETVNKIINGRIIKNVGSIKGYDDFICYLLYSYYNDNLDLESLKLVINELSITKSMIKNTSEYIYDIVGVEKWDIE